MKKYKRVFSMFHLTRPIFLVDLDFRCNCESFTTDIKLARDVDCVTNEEKELLISKGYDILKVSL